MNMIKANLRYILLLLIAGSVVAGCSNMEEQERPPNIIYIFTDDLGYGDIGVFGAKDIETPNIDRMANEGMKMTASYSVNSICSPSRAAFLTGRYPARMGIHSVFFPESFTGLPPEELIIPEVLGTRGYVSGIVGKWHLGHHYKFLPLQQGFDEYFGLPYSNDMTNLAYIRGNEIISYDVDQRYLTKRYTEESLKFIEKNKEQPFFLYIPHNMPHVPIYASPEFQGTSERGLYGDVIQELDWSVGQILDKLEELNLMEQTLVIFTSDNGPWLVMEQLGGSNGPLRQGKFYSFEGGHRVPMVAMWKGKIPAGSVYDELNSQLDWLPTFASIAGADLPQDIEIDGEDISPILLGETKQRQDTTFMYFERNGLMAFRSGRWKVKKPFDGFEMTRWRQGEPAHDTLLFDLKLDPGETNNLFKEKPELTRKLFRQMEREYKALGELPPPLVMTNPADLSHYEILGRANEE